MSDKPWLKDRRTHPRWDDYLELEQRARKALEAVQAAHACFVKAEGAKRLVFDLIYGDWKRLDRRCDLCRKRMPREVAGWETWPVDEVSGDMRCRCSECAG